MGLIRLLLASAVLFAHEGSPLGLPVLPAEFAVQAFFAISGFYMTMVLEEKYLPQAGAYRMFLWSRLTRLAPTYLTVLVLALLFQTAAYVRFHSVLGAFGRFLEHPERLDGPARFVVGLANVAIVGQDWLMFAAVDPMSHALRFSTQPFQEAVPAHSFLLVPQAWSLAVELSFYAVAPFLVRRSTRVLLGLAALSLAARWLAGERGLVQDPWSYRFFPFECVFFVAGILSYRLHRAGDGWVGKRVPEWTAVAAISLLIPAIFAFGWLPAFPAKGGVFVAGVALTTPLLFRITRANDADRLLADLAYPLYLVHLLVGSALSMAGLRSPLATLVAALAAAGMLLAWVEHPLRAWRRRALHRARAGAAGQEKAYA